MAKLPSVATTFGWISSICRNRWLSHASISSGCGSRLPGGRHLRTFAMYTSRARRGRSREQLVEQLARLADERDALLVLVEAGRLARRTSGRRPGRRRRRRPASAPRASRHRVQPAVAVGVAPRARRIGGSARAQGPQPQQPPQQPPPARSAEARLLGGAVRREHRELPARRCRAAVGAIGRRRSSRTSSSKWRLALHADELVDRHRRGSVGIHADRPASHPSGERCCLTGGLTRPSQRR